jgi:predicted ATPase
MRRAARLVGRRRELAWLGAAMASAREGRGALVLVSGEAGVGKTRLVEEAAARHETTLLVGGSTGASGPYAPVVIALRSFLRRYPDGLSESGPPAPCLATLLPELGKPDAPRDRATLNEALRAALRCVGDRQAAVFLDDLHWADHSTLDALASLAAGLEQDRCLVVAAYRSDDMPRGHPLRLLRRELRRGGRLNEITVEPLDPAGTLTVARSVLGARPAPSLASLIQERTEGIPFFVEELCAALSAGDRLQPGDAGLALRQGSDLPVPESIRDAVLVRAARLSEDARTALDVAAVAGHRVDLDLVVELGGESGVDELLASGMLVEAAGAQASFRHALTREALYADVTWTRRRTLHRLLAERLELRHAPSLTVAEHWLQAREFHRACPVLAGATRDFATVHAYHDALARVAGRSRSGPTAWTSRAACLSSRTSDGTRS